MNLEDFIKDLDPELQEKARACGSTEELLALAKEAKVPLPDEALAAIAGGADAESVGCGEEKCPKCGSKDFDNYKVESNPFFETYYFRCNACGATWDKTYNRM